MNRFTISTLMSVLVLASGAIGFQIGQPSANDLAKRIDGLETEIGQLQGQVMDLSLYVGKDMSWIADESESSHLWIYIAIPASDYHSSSTSDVCDGYTNLTPSNLGVADSISDPFIWPNYGIYLGTSSYTSDQGEECVREYFFPNLARSQNLYLGEWVDSGGMRRISSYWELSWSDIDWTDPFIYLRP